MTTSTTRAPVVHRLTVRTAGPADLPELHAMAARAVGGLLTRHFTPEQLRAAAAVRVYEVEPELVDAGTYYVVEVDGVVVASCGWSPGGPLRPGEDRQVADGTAAIRAAYVEPRWARRGLTGLLARTAETAAVMAGFRRFEALCTPAGEALLRSLGYAVVGRVETPLGGGVTATVSRLRKDLT